MKKQLHYVGIFILLLFTSHTLHAQWDDGLWVGKQAYNWPFSHGLSLDFNSTPPEIGESAVGTLDLFSGGGGGLGAISDSEGNLLFYNGPLNRRPFYMFNAQNQPMPNGDSLYTNELNTQTGIIIPKPQNNDMYYVFTQASKGYDSTDVGTPAFDAGLYYSVVDMTLDNGLGDVTDMKNISLISPAGDQQTAVHHANGEDVWLIVTRGGASVSPDFDIGTIDGNDFEVGPGNTILTNNYLAFLITEDGIAEPVISSVGDTISVGRGSMKASPTGTKIAIASAALLDPNLQVFDFNNETGELSNPINLILNFGLFGAYGVEFSPNGRFLYVAEPGFPFGYTRVHQFDLNAGDEEAIIQSDYIVYQGLHDINDGDVRVIQVGPDGKIYIMLQGSSADAKSGISVINYPNNKGEAAGFEHLYYSFGIEGNVPNANNKFGGVNLPGFIQSYFESGILHEGECPAPSEVTFSTIRIPGIESIAWDFGDPDSGEANTSDEPHHVFSAPGTYTVTAQITSNGAQQTATTEITIIEGAVATQPENLIACDDGTGNASFDLTQQNTIILGNQDSATRAITYHISQSEAENNVNSISDPTNYTSSGETLYVRVTNTDTGCYDLTQFELIANPNVELPDGLELHTCSSFDLTFITEEIEEGLDLSYYPTQAEAENGSNAITDTLTYTITTREASIYLRGENEEGCMDIVAIQLFRGDGDCIIPQGISPNGDAINQRFDLSHLDINNLQIFNRYGRTVFEAKEYTNEWEGQSMNGDELPTGTYFYVIKLAEGETFDDKQVLTGWVYLNREVN